MLSQDPRREYEFSELGSVQTTLVDKGEVAPHQLDDVLAGAAHLGLRRGKLLGIGPGLNELAFALSIFTWWPFKPRPSAEVEAHLSRLREPLFSGLATTLNFGGLDETVPDETLKLTPDELSERQQRSVQSFLVVGRTKEFGASES